MDTAFKSLQYQYSIDSSGKWSLHNSDDTKLITEESASILASECFEPVHFVTSSLATGEGEILLTDYNTPPNLSLVALNTLDCDGQRNRFFISKQSHHSSNEYEALSHIHSKRTLPLFESPAVPLAIKHFGRTYAIYYQRLYPLTLSDLINKHGNKVPDLQAYLIAEQLLLAIEKLHSKEVNIAHSSLSSDVVFIDFTPDRYRLPRIFIGGFEHANLDGIELEIEDQQEDVETVSGKDIIDALAEKEQYDIRSISMIMETSVEEKKKQKAERREIVENWIRDKQNDIAMAGEIIATMVRDKQKDHPLKTFANHLMDDKPTAEEAMAELEKLYPLHPKGYTIDIVK